MAQMNQKLNSLLKTINKLRRFGITEKKNKNLLKI